MHSKHTVTFASGQLPPDADKRTVKAFLTRHEAPLHVALAGAGPISKEVEDLRTEVARARILLRKLQVADRLAEVGVR